MGSAANSSEYEYLIVGGGPAGLQMAYFFEKAKASYAVIEAGPVPGNFFVKYPRHGTLISINKRFNYFPEDDFNFRHDWNSLISDDKDLLFTKYSDKLFPPTSRLVDYMKDYAEKFNLNIVYNTKVEKISKDGEKFTLKTNAGTTLTAQIVVMACGAMVENIPDFPGIELATKYSEHTLDQSYYDNKKIAIVGGGNSGFETADHLAGHAGIIHIYNDSPFKMAWDTHFPGNLRAINNTIIDMFHLKSLHALREAKPTAIEEVSVDGKRKLKMSYDQDMPTWSRPCTAHFYDSYDEIIWAAGWKYVMPDMFDDNCKPDISACGKFPTQSDCWESTNVKNLFFAGTVTQARDRRAASSFIHGFRYSAAVLTKLLLNWRNGLPLKKDTFDSINLDTLSDKITKRYSTASAMYQLNYGVLCDVVLFNPEFEKGSQTVAQGPDYKGSVKVIYELPTEYVLRTERFTKQEHMWLLILKDGKSYYPNMKPTDFCKPSRVTEVDSGCQAFIQPILRRYRFGEMVEEFALGGNFTVRCDVDVLGIKGNPQRIPNKIRNLALRQLGIEGPEFDARTFDEETTAKHFVFWDDARIEQEKMKKEQMTKRVPCTPSFGGPKWVRKGMDIVNAEPEMDR